MLHNFLRFVVLAAAFAITITLQAQDKNPPDNNTQEKPKSQTDALLTTSTVPVIDLNTKRTLKEKEKLQKELGELVGSLKKDKKAPQEKKEPKGYYRGVKGRKTFIRAFSGKRTIIEKFAYVNDDKAAPPPYTTEVYYYDTKKQKIFKTGKFDREKGFLLHGLYTKKVNDLVQEEGYFYFGVKDGRWEKFNKDTLLTDKKYYEKGNFAESVLTYYDKKQKVLKEKVSINDGRKEGEYLYYYPSGRLALKGQYAEDSKIGVWYEYYDQVKYSRKRELKFPDDPFEDRDSTVIREWDNKGKMLIDNSRNK